MGERPMRIPSTPVRPYAIVANMLTHGSNDPRQDFALAVINAHLAQ